MCTLKAVLVDNHQMQLATGWPVAESDLFSFRKYLRHDDGATAVEYGLIAGIIGGALIVGFGAFSDQLSAMFNMLADLIKY